MSVVAIAHALHSVRNWEDNPVQIGCILGSSSYITEVCRQRNLIIEQQAELHQQEEVHRRQMAEKEAEIERQALHHREDLTRQAEELTSNTLSQRATITELAQRLDHQSNLIQQLQETHSQLESVPRISTSIATPSTSDYGRRMTRNPNLPIFSGFDTILEFTTDVSVVAIAHALHSVRNWEDNPVQIGCILGSSSYITEVCRQRNLIIEQQAELHQQEEVHRRQMAEKEAEIERQALHHREDLTRQAEELTSNTLSQRATITELAQRLDHQSNLIQQLQETHSQLESVPRISTSIATPSTSDYGRRMTRNPNLPIFSGEKPTPKEVVEYDNWIFQVKNLRKTYTDDAIKNGVVACVRGVANIIVRSAGIIQP